LRGGLRCRKMAAVLGADDCRGTETVGTSSSLLRIPSSELEIDAPSFEASFGEAGVRGVDVAGGAF
jgi:hypothetical protein